MKLFRLFAYFSVLFLIACASSPNRLPVATPSPLILISIDGFRADYLQRGLTPTLDQLIGESVRAEFLRPSFPSLTFPNHYTLVTGLRPDRNGVVANRMEDRRIRDQKFSTGNRDAIGNQSWWEEAVPLWRTAQRHGLISGTMFWPGSEAPVHGDHPDYWVRYDQKINAQQRVDTVLNWLDQPEKSPTLLTLYFDDVDGYGHYYGPDSAEVGRAIGTVDTAIARLLKGLEQRGLRDTVNLVIVSDHGMTSTSPKRVVLLDDIIPADFAHIVSYGAVTGIVPTRENRKEVEARLLAPHEHMQCWRKADLPERFHYGKNRRVPPLLCLAAHGWVILDRPTLAAKKNFSYGEHGYDIDHPEMRAIFIANGPAFKRGVTVPGFDNVDVYPLLAHLLGVAPEKNDGNPATMIPMLREPSSP